MGGFLWLSGVLWVPDLLAPGSVHVLGGCPLRGSGSVELTQIWAGDGYLTGVRHTLPDGRSFFTVGDSDAPRALRCVTVLYPEDRYVAFHFNDQDWRYYWEGHVLHSRHGLTTRAD